MKKLLNFFKIIKCKLIRKKTDFSNDEFKKLFQDIKELAILIEKVWNSDHELHKKIKKIKKEIDNLERILNNKLFNNLTYEQKIQLKKSLLISKQELLKCVQEAPCPTERIQ